MRRLLSWSTVQNCRPGLLVVFVLLVATGCGVATQAQGERSPALVPQPSAVPAQGTAVAPATAQPSPVAPTPVPPPPTATAIPEQVEEAVGPTETPAETVEETKSTDAPSPSLPSASTALCAQSNPTAAGELEDDDIVEASGLTRSTSHDGWWLHNDGGRAEVFAIGPTGQELGTVRIDDVDLSDVEDMASWTRDGRRELLLADIGDNRQQRGTDRPLLVLDEPAVDADRVSAAEYTLRYPDVAHNAEVLLVDGATGEIVIVTKEQDPERDIQPELLPALIYAGSFQPQEPVIALSLVGRIDISLLAAMSEATRSHPFSALGIGGVLTGGDVSTDGAAIALRSYGAVWIWDRPPGTSLAESLLGAPCEARSGFEVQGEALAFAADGSWATVSEGRFPVLWISGD